MFTLLNGRRLLAPAAVLPPHRHFSVTQKCMNVNSKLGPSISPNLWQLVASQYHLDRSQKSCERQHSFQDAVAVTSFRIIASREAILFLQFLKKCSQTSCVKTSGLIVQMSLGTEMGTLVNIIVILVDMCVDTHHWGGTLTTKSCTENLPSQSYL